MCSRLLAEDHAVADRFGHRLDGGEARHAAGDQRQKNQTEKNAAQKPGVRLN